MEVYFGSFQKDGWSLQLGWQPFTGCPDTAPLLQTNRAELVVENCAVGTCTPMDLLTTPTLGGCHTSIAADWGLGGPEFVRDFESADTDHQQPTGPDGFWQNPRYFTGVPTQVAHLRGTKDHFQVKWEGKLKLPPNGRWVFSSQADDGARLYVDQNNDGIYQDTELILDRWEECCVTHSTSPISLMNGQETLTIKYEMHVSYLGGFLRFCADPLNVALCTGYRRQGLRISFVCGRDANASSRRFYAGRFVRGDKHNQSGIR